MKISTYSAIMKVKYYLKPEHNTSLQKYQSKSRLRDPVDRSLVYKMRTAWARYVKRTEENKTEKHEIKLN